MDRIIEIQEGKADFYSGNYSFYAVEKERRYEEKLKQYEKEQAKIQQLEKAAEQLRIWAYSGNDKIFKRAPVHGEAHRADADHRQAHPGAEDGGLLRGAGVPGG